MADEHGPPLRIALNAAFWGQETVGSGQYLHHLVDALAGMGDDLEIVLCGPPALQQRRSLPAGVSWYGVAAPPWLGAGSNLRKVWLEQVGYARATRATGASVAHVPYFASPLFPGIPTVVTVHDLIPLLLPAYRTSALVRGYMRLVVRSAQRADLVLTDAEASRRDICHHLRLPAERVRAVPLATTPAYHPVEDPSVLARTRARYGLPERYLLYLGGFDERRNLATLFQGLAAARRREPGLPILALVGVLPTADTRLAPDPRRLAAEAGLAEGVLFAGRAAEEDKPALYSGALAFVFPSRYEGFGLPVLEALACGTPVACADATTLPEVGGPGALLVSPDDPGAWAEALVRLAGDAELRGRLRSAGLAHAATFSWERTARETLAAYHDVARRAPQPAGDATLRR